jgi:hypothetical protein
MCSPESSPSDAVVAAVAEREGVPRHELDGSLYEAVDPDALDDLFNDTHGWVTFGFLGYTVTVDSDQEVAVSSGRPE